MMLPPTTPEEVNCKYSHTKDFYFECLATPWPRRSHHDDWTGPRSGGWGLLTCLDLAALYRLSQFRLAYPGLLAQFPRSPPNIHEYLILLVTYLSPRIIIIHVIIFRIEWHSDMLVVNDVTSNNFRGSQLQVQRHKGFLI